MTDIEDRTHDRPHVPGHPLADREPLTPAGINDCAAAIPARPQATQALRDADHAQAIAEDVRHLVATVARNAGSSTTLAVIGRLRDRAHAEALAEDDARSVAEGRKLLGWDETPEQPVSLTITPVEARTGISDRAAAALGSVAAVRELIIDNPDRLPVSLDWILGHLDRAEQTLRAGGAA